ncbi:MAG: oligosaccharide flippase family protein [Polyangia bacterium]
MSDAAANSTPVMKGAVSAGRGLLFITAAKLWFMVAGYAIQFALPRALQSPAKYGAYGVVLACVSLFNNVMVTGTIQAVSRFVAQLPARVGDVVRAALSRQLILGGVVAAGFIGGAPLFARYWLHDPAYASYLRVAGIVTFCYALYAVFVGSANGQRQFQKQASLDMTFATLRAGAVIGAAVVTHSVLASLGGFAAAAVLILLLSAAWVGVGARTQPLEGREMERFFGQVAGYLVLVNLLMFIDGLTLKRLVTIAASGLGEHAAAAAGDTQAGFYSAVQTVARLPYQLILAVTFVIFPIISRTTFEADAERAKRYVVVTMRYSLLVVALMAVALAARPTATLSLLFPPEYAVAAAALPVLIFGYLSFSLFNILGTILNGAGDTAASLRAGLVTVVVCAVSVYAALSYALATGHDARFAAAMATAVSMTLGALLAGWAVHKRFGAVIGWATPVRVLIASVVGLGVGRAWPNTGFLGGKVGTLLSLCAIGVAYLAVVSPELRPSELRRLRNGT